MAALSRLLRRMPLPPRGRFIASSSLPPHTLLAMPRLSPTMDAGSVASWAKVPGDAIEAGDVLAEIETDKATRSLEYNDDGFLARVFVADGDPAIPVGDALAIVVEDEAHISAFADYLPARPEAPKSAPKAAPVASPTSPPPTPPPQKKKADPGARVIASPLARIRALEAGVALTDVEGSGAGGMIVAEDVAAAAAKAASAPPSPAPAAPAHDIVASASAERIADAKRTVPHYYLTTEIGLCGLEALVERVNAAAGDGISVDDFVIKAAAAALRRVPEVNAQWMGDKVRVFDAADICVALPSGSGMVVPVVRDVGRKGVREIAADVRALAAKALDGGLESDDVEGGTFTITNLGASGVDEFAAIVNAPQAAILAVGAAGKMLVPDAASEKGYKVETVMKVTLSCDHRVVDGAVGAQWLKAFKQCLEDPVEGIL